MATKKKTAKKTVKASASKKLGAGGRQTNIATIADASLSPAKSTVADADGLGGSFWIRKPFLTSDPADIPIYVTNAPFAFRVLDAQVLVSTNTATTGTVRTAAAGAGTAITDAMSFAAAGRVRAGVGAGNATVSIAAAGSLYFNRSGTTAAGELLILIQKV